jgi:hypothetical protein
MSVGLREPGGRVPGQDRLRSLMTSRGMERGVEVAVLSSKAKSESVVFILMFLDSDFLGINDSAGYQEETREGSTTLYTNI